MALSKVGTNQIDTAATPTVAEATVTGDLTVDTNTLVVDAANNRVGIGTASPSSAALHIDSGSDNANTLMLSDGAADGNIVDGFVTSRHHSVSEEPVLMIQGRSTSSENIVLIGGTHNNSTYNTATSIKFFTASGYTNTTPVEKMRIDASGRVTTPNQTMFHANFTGTGQHSTSATNGHLVFNEVPVNVGGHYSTSNGRFTAPVTGNYWFAFNWQAHGGHNGSGYADLHRNGVGYYRYRAEGSGQNYDTRSMSGIVAMNANDYINIHFQDQRKLHQHFTAWSVYLIG